MKIAIVGDPHIATGFRARVDDYLHTVLRKIKDIANENDAVIFLGDMFDTSAMPTYVFNITYKTLEPYKGKLHTILGNHDMFHRNLKSLNRTTIGSFDLTDVIKVHAKPFKINKVEFVPVMTDDVVKDIPKDETNTKILLCHKYYEMLVCPEESLTGEDLKGLNYKYVFMGHDHQPYEPITLDNTILYRPGSLTRTTVDMYNKDRKIRYYQLDTVEKTVQECIVQAEKSEDVYLKGSFEKTDNPNKIKTDIKSLSKLLARFDKKQLSNLSLEDVMRNQLKATEEQILYIRELHRLHNIKYN